MLDQYWILHYSSSNLFNLFVNYYSVICARKWHIPRQHIYGLRFYSVNKALLLFVCFYHMIGRQPGMYIVYHPPRGTKLSGTENEFYDDLDIMFTDASISAVPVIILGDFNIHFNDVLKPSKLSNLLQDFQLNVGGVIELRN